jgi:hypothetical protein
MIMRGLHFVTAMSFFTIMGAPAHAETSLFPSSRSVVRPGFVFSGDSVPHILLFRPDIDVKEETIGGMQQPNADWTQKARENLIAALKDTQIQRGNTFEILPELSSDDTAASEYRALFKVVVDAALRHEVFPGDILPNKAKRFDWTLGPGIGRFAKAGVSTYGLFILSQDSYPSAARSKSDVLSSIMGESENRNSQKGYAALIDMKTGDLVWLSTDLRMRGDVRTPSGAAVRTVRLLEGFPKNASADNAAKKK